MSAHTPGPWIADLSGRKSWPAIRPCRPEDGGPTGFLLAQVRRETPDDAGMYEIMGGSVEANARLIAAAPELLAALDTILRRLESLLGCENSMLTEIGTGRAAIKKATEPTP